MDREIDTQPDSAIKHPEIHRVADQPLEKASIAVHEQHIGHSILQLTAGLTYHTIGRLYEKYGNHSGKHVLKRERQRGLVFAAMALPEVVALSGLKAANRLSRGLQAHHDQSPVSLP